MRRKLATTLTAALLITSTLTAPSAFAGTTSAQAYTCSFEVQEPYAYAGHYYGMSVIPSSSGVSSSGIEAQCLLKWAGFDPGTIDGVFGTNSRAAAKRFQSTMNSAYGYNLATDGIVGSRTWPVLRTYVYARS
jgi:hypothetical protein